MIIWVALCAAGALTLLALRSMAYALGSTVETRPRLAERGSRASKATRTRRYFASGEAAMLMIEIALSLGIALATVGLAATAALPARLTIGALLAQVAVLGSLVAPPVTVDMFGVRARPAAIALGVAQLANAVFFIKAIQALT